MINQLRLLLVSAFDTLREKLWETKTEHCIQGCARLRTLDGTPLLQTLAGTLRLHAKRWLHLTAELKELDATLEQLTAQTAKRFRSQFGIGSQTAATLLSVAGDNPERLRKIGASMRRWRVSLARSKWKVCITTALPTVSRLGKWFLNTSRCSTIVSGVMRIFVIKPPRISLTSFMPAGNNLRPNYNGLAYPLNLSVYSIGFRSKKT